MDGVTGFLDAEQGPGFQHSDFSRWQARQIKTGSPASFLIRLYLVDYKLVHLLSRFFLVLSFILAVVLNPIIALFFFQSFS